ncbi:hypothetical protein [Bacillus phage SRT01hs]|uniref:Uncharacterized protein n=1 Tax=Bacillus phage SRT01hs TaxID=2847044 RepID=A0A6B9SY93_9CAUD|nr:hypothetical protein H3022_gp25 [Bacillus phage SRT01hs]QHJ75877.1 hypothetical protein [Bacillus phage SRT01hs]
MNEEKMHYRDAIKEVELTMMSLDSHFRTHKEFTDSYLLVLILEDVVGETRVEVSEGLTFDEASYIIGGTSDNILNMHMINYCEKNREEIYKWLKVSRVNTFKSNYAKMLLNTAYGKDLLKGVVK